VSADGHIGVYPPLAPASLWRPARHDWFPLDRPGLRLTHLGRGAVWLALEALGLGPGSRLAMPAYHCGSEVEAAHLAGLEIDFYRVDGQLRVDADTPFPVEADGEILGVTPASFGIIPAVITLKV